MRYPKGWAFAYLGLTLRGKTDFHYIQPSREKLLQTAFVYPSNPTLRQGMDMAEQMWIPLVQQERIRLSKDLNPTTSPAVAYAPIFAYLGRKGVDYIVKPNLRHENPKQ